MLAKDSTGDSTLGKRVKVLIPLPLASAYDYLVPDTLSAQLGTFVVVPLGNREVIGVIWGEAESDLEEKKLKVISQKIDLAPISDEMIRFIDWTANYTMSKPGAVLRMAMSVPSVFAASPKNIAYVISKDPKDRSAKVTEARKKVFSALADGSPRKMAELVKSAKVSPSVIRVMSELKMLSAITVERDQKITDIEPAGDAPILSDAQMVAATALKRAVIKSVKQAEPRSNVLVLDGVTGSGKTETYFEAISATLEKGRQVLVLLPEIALTTQWLSRFETRFGSPPLQWHSELSKPIRRSRWLAANSGVIHVFVGARSALYLPFSNLGLIIVDEEHDTSFKQEDGVIYNARDMAVVRGRTAGVPVVLATATPSLETVFNIQNGRYQKLSLPERHGGASLPKVFVVDMKAESLGTDNYISAELEKRVADTFNANQQSMLFLNRRGYAPLTLCRNCGHRITCSHCTAWLVEHRLKGKLECHHCGSSRFLPKECPNCYARESLVPIGPGVERLAEEVVRKFPSARVEIMTSDTIRSPSTASCFINRMQKSEIDILIGTQIVAKGHHFPNLTLVGVVDADLGLSGGDLRASERVYQTLQQVAGRAGRADREGSVILQTYQPENPIIQAMVSGDRDRFLDLEGKAREHYEMPPYGRLAALIISGENISRVEEAVNGMGKARPIIPGLQVLGPAEAPLSILRGRHRRRFLIKARPGVRIQPVIHAWLSRSRIQSGVRVQIDIDPYSFM